ncbi:MAG: hypothetical protein FWH04_02010 [Oscillospiraceae bacterium]|nr:hypothetical protein [Oscillospiraceae bacterium]
MFANSFALCRFYLRRECPKTIIWFVLILGLAVGFGAGISGMYPDQDSLDAMLEPLNNPSFKAMLGQYYLDGGVLTLGSMYSVYTLVWLLIIVGCMNAALVVCHTRKDEEFGRLEVVRSLPVGRMSNLSAVLTAAVILNAILALLIGLGLGTAAEAGRGMDYAGAFATGGACAAFGIVMAGVSAVFCQLNKHPGTAMAWSFGFLGMLYMTFMMGSMQENQAAVNISILGLAQRSMTFVANDWAPIILTALIGIVLCIKALWLCKIRDLGESLIPSAPGRSDAKASLKSPGALAWRLLRGWCAFWAIVVFLLGYSYGSVMGDMEAFIESNDVFRQISQGNVMVMVSTFLLIVSVMGVLPILNFMLKARSEEKRGYAENILAHSASRGSQLRGYFIISLVAAVLVPFISAAGFRAGSVLVMDDPIPFGNWIISCVVYTPAILVLLGVAVALIGWLPKFTGWVWGYLGYTFVALYLGTLMGIPEWASKLTPFGHVPKLPYVEQIGSAPYILPDGTPLLDEKGVRVITPIFADEATYALTGNDIAAMIIMTVLSAVLFILGFIGYSNRDSE